MEPGALAEDGDRSGGEGSLGALRMLGRALDLYRRHFWLFFGLALAATLAATFGLRLPLDNWLFERMWELPLPDEIDPTPIKDLLLGTVEWCALLFFEGFFVHVALTLSMGQGMRPGSAVTATLASVIPILVLCIATALITMAGTLLLIVPGIYLSAAYYVLLPVIVFERSGMGGMSRTWRLGRGHRWAIALMLVVTLSLSYGVWTLHDALIPQSWYDFGTREGEAVFYYWPDVLIAVIQALLFPVLSLPTVTVYLRLREIKEGGQAEQLVEVFE